MKKLIFFFVLFSLSSILSAQIVIDEEGFETFTSVEGDTSYIMKKYFFCMLKSGENRDQSEEELAELMKGHLAHLSSLAESKKACMIGPMGDDTDLRGIVIYNTTTQKEAEQLANEDPMVKAGRLIVEIHPWWCAKGTYLF